MINIILFGGLSECGKSHASKHSMKHGFVHMKIIFFEKRVMKQFGLDPEDINSFKELYDRDHNIVFEKFWDEIKRYCKINNIKNIALDSTTRQDMVIFFQNKNNVNFISVYIEADLKRRINREFLKNNITTYAQIKRQTIEKDDTKIKRKANLVRGLSVIVSNNNTIENFNKKIETILNILKNNNIRQEKNLFFIMSKNIVYKYIDSKNTIYPITEPFFIKNRLISEYILEMPFLHGDTLHDCIKTKDVDIKDELKEMTKNLKFISNSEKQFFYERLPLINSSYILKNAESDLNYIFNKKLPSWFSNGDFHGDNILGCKDILFIDLDYSNWNSIAFDLATFFAYEIIHYDINSSSQIWIENLIKIFNFLFKKAMVTMDEFILLWMFRIWTINETHNILDRKMAEGIIEFIDKNKDLSIVLKGLENVIISWR